MPSRNRYAKGNGFVLGSHGYMSKVYKPKLVILQQILRLSAANIAETFGVVGKPLVEGVRHELVRELDACTTPLSSWREVADRLLNREHHDDL